MEVIKIKTMKQEITKEKAIEELKELFNIPDEQTKETWMNGYETDGRFGINKLYMERFYVIEKLHEYFKDKMFEKGLGLVVGSITFIYTNFEIKEITKQ